VTANDVRAPADQTSGERLLWSKRRRRSGLCARVQGIRGPSAPPTGFDVDPEGYLLAQATEGERSSTWELASA
jgi:hypothetical protein